MFASKLKSLIKKFKFCINGFTNKSHSKSGFSVFYTYWLPLASNTPKYLCTFLMMSIPISIQAFGQNIIADSSTICFEDAFVVAIQIND